MPRNADFFSLVSFVSNHLILRRRSERKKERIAAYFLKWNKWFCLKAKQKKWHNLRFDQFSFFPLMILSRNRNWLWSWVKIWNKNIIRLDRALGSSPWSTSGGREQFPIKILFNLDFFPSWQFFFEKRSILIVKHGSYWHIWPIENSI